MTSQALPSQDHGIHPESLDRMQRWFGLIVIAPALILPIYQQFLHGGRDAASIAPRADAYLAAHILGATCSALLLFGLIAIYLKHAAMVGKLGLTALVVAVFGQAAWAGGLLVDGTFNSLLALYDPALQTNVHSGSPQRVSASSDMVGGLLATFELLFAVNILTYLAGYLMIGAMIVRTGIMPRWIGVLLVAGAPLVATSLITPPWAESLGYAALGAAFAWAGFLLWKPKPTRQGRTQAF
ncbi:MAG TPA: hypothetical protein VFM91_09640 [Propionibacteriaceae bacterium]|nr:hypothetical protein [Propionibacteriaceae bacterium]